MNNQQTLPVLKPELLFNPYFPLEISILLFRVVCFVYVLAILGQRLCCWVCIVNQFIVFDTDEWEIQVILIVCFLVLVPVLAL